MTADTAVCIAAICVALMVSITVLVATVVVVEGLAPRPKHRRRRAPRRVSPGAQYWVHPEYAAPAAGWSR